MDVKLEKWFRPNIDKEVLKELTKKTYEQIASRVGSPETLSRSMVYISFISYTCRGAVHWVPRATESSR